MNSGERMYKTTNLIKLVFIVILSLVLIYSLLLFASSAAKNLIANPGFESGSTQPSNWEFVTTDGNTPVWDSIHHNGTKSIKISIPGTTARDSGYPKSDPVKAEPQQYYTLSVWGKTENASASHVPAVRVVELDANKNWLHQINLAFDKGTNDWIRKSIDFQTGPNTAYLYIYANIGSGYGTFWVDDVSLSRISAPAPMPIAKPSHTTAPTPALVHNTYYVAKNGNDNNPGTEQSPWLTITKAANTLAAGDTVYIKEGIYNEKILINNSGSPGKIITFAAYPGDNVTIDGTGTPVEIWDGQVQIFGSSYINISGFRIINSKFMGVMVTSDYGSNFPTNITIEKNYISNTASSAIFIEDGKNITIDGNEITKAQTMEGLSSQTHETITLAWVNGFEIKNNKVYNNNFESIVVKRGSSHGKIYQNDVSQHQSSGIYIDAWNEAAHDIEIFSNGVHNGSASGARGISVAVENKGSLKNVRVYNNVVYNNAAVGLNLAWYTNGPIDNITFINNVVYNNGLVDNWGGGINIQYGSATNITVSNNIVSQNRNYQIVNKAGVNATITNNLIDGYVGGQDETKGIDYIEGNPQFADPTNGDFHLKSTSPAIGKGSSFEAPAFDFDRNSRPPYAAYDIGAFEHKQ